MWCGGQKTGAELFTCAVNTQEIYAALANKSGGQKCNPLQESRVGEICEKEEASLFLRESEGSVYRLNLGWVTVYSWKKPMLFGEAFMVTLYGSDEKLGEFGGSACASRPNDILNHKNTEFAKANLPVLQRGLKTYLGIELKDPREE